MSKYKSPVPRLTINQIAAATLRTDKRAWRSLAAGIFLSLFLISAMVMSVRGVMLAQREQLAQRVGYADCFLLDTPETTDTALRETGRFDEIGHVMMTSQIEGGDRYVGFYDETAARLMNRQVIEGRMPEAAGEIALDEAMLEYLRADFHPGDKLTLELKAIDGFSETRSFTVVGILADQSLDASMWSSAHILKFPSAIVSALEPGFSTGRTVVHRVMTLSKGVSRSAVMASWSASVDHMFCLDSYGSLRNYISPLEEFAERYVNITTLIVILLGASLVLSAGVGVAQAMEGQLTKRVEEIGMLRAVGATRRQIRRIFGRQTWLIALILAPVSIAAGCAFAWALSRFLPNTVTFSLSPGVLIPMLILSVLTIWLSSSLPLRRASRIMPMSVIRDTRLLRKAKRVKSQNEFNPARLLAARQTRLHPTRQLGAALMAALMLFCAAIGALGVLDSLRGSGDTSDFRILNEDYIWYSPSFADIDFTNRFLTDGDIAQLRALPHMESVVTVRQMQVDLLADSHSDYLTLASPYLTEDEATRQTIGLWDYELDKKATRSRLVQAYLGTDSLIAEYPLKAISLSADMRATLEALVVEGKIDMEALDAGREVLVYAPTVYMLMDSRGSAFHSLTEKDRMNRGFKAVYKWENDFFHAGGTLNLVQLIGQSEWTDLSSVSYELMDESDDSYMAWLQTCERHDAAVRVGAVLSGAEQYESSLALSTESCVIATEKGLRAMGLYPKTMNSVNMYLDGPVDDETGEYLSRRVNAIAARADTTYVYDGVKFARSRRVQLMQLVLAFSAMTIMFFAVTVGLVSGNVSRRVRADQRMIGTLRAVGADERVLTRCYGTQIGAGLAAGYALALAIVAALMFGLMYGVTAAMRLIVFGVLTLLAALCVVCCLFTLRRSLRDTMKKSIVENIREL